MIYKITHYRVKEEVVDQTWRAIKKFVGEIKANEPETGYYAYQSNADPTAFFHAMAFPTLEAEQKHQQAEYTAAFVEVLYPLCTELPEFTDLTQIAGTN